jgi:NADPH2:quinone reductase
LQVGDLRVIFRGDTGGTRPGTFAEKVVVPAEDLAPVPPGWSEPQAGGAMLVYLTAWQALTMWGELVPDDVVLVTGASGGVGVASTQLAAALGCQVIAVSRGTAKHESLRKLGAAITVDITQPRWRSDLKATLAPKKVKLAVDNIGGTLLPEVIDLLGMNGSVSLVGRLAGPVPNFNTATLFFRRLKLGGVAVGTYTRAESIAAWSRVLALLEKSGARPLVDSIFEMDQLPAAFERLAAGPMGKVLLKVTPA